MNLDASLRSFFDDVVVSLRRDTSGETHDWKIEVNLEALFCLIRSSHNLDLAKQKQLK